MDVTIKLKGRLPLVTFIDIGFILSWSQWFNSLPEFINNMIATNMSAMVVENENTVSILYFSII